MQPDRLLAGSLAQRSLAGMVPCLAVPNPAIVAAPLDNVGLCTVFASIFSFLALS